MKKLFPLVKILLGWPISLLALIFIFRTITAQKGSISLSLQEVNLPIFFFGLLVLLLYFFLRSFFWQQILKEKGYELPVREIAWLFASSELKRYAPGKIWSFLGRAMLFSKQGVKNKDVFSGLLIEAGFQVVSSILLSIIALPLLGQTIPFFQFLLNPFVFIVNLVLIIIATLIFIFSSALLKKFNLKLLWHILPDFSPSVNLRLLVISLAFTFLFGLGTYATILAITPLTGSSIEWIAFFVFAFLVGYLSFVTPMGLGVREGVITIGLSKAISIAAAGFASIYSRIIFILAELIFLAVALFFFNIKTLSLRKTFAWLNLSKYYLLLFALIFTYVIYFTTASFLRHENFYSGRYDLGNMDQTVWNTFHGRIFQANNDYGAISSRLSAHADLLLVLLSPSYFLWEDPRMLLFLQTLILALGAVFIFLLTQKIVGNKTIGILFSFAYLINPHIQHANLYDFHAVAFATTFLLGAFYFLIQKKYLWFLVFAILAGLTKEQLWLIVALFGVYIFVFFKKRLFGAILIFTSLCIFYLLIWQVIPSFRETPHFALSYYSDFGDSPAEIIKNTVLSPQKVAGTLFASDRIEYMRRLFSPLGFLSLASPLYILFALPDLLINLLSNNPNLRQIYYHYASVITPFAFIAAIYGFKNLQKKIPIMFLGVYLLAFALLSASSFGPLPEAKNPNIIMFVNPQPKKEVIKKVISQIPKEYTVAATNNLGAHLSQRQRLYTIPEGIDQADILIFLLNDGFAQPSLEAQKEMVEKLGRNPDYEELFRKDDFFLFKKKGVQFFLALD